MKFSTKPVIGICLDYAEGDHKYNYSAFPWYGLRRNYTESIIAAGGLPIMLPFQRDVEQLVALIDGLLVPGSETDIYPELYGQQISSNRVVINKEKTDFEAAIMLKALENNIAVLGICNGMQLLNVVTGGTLIQHIPDHFASFKHSSIYVNHEQPSPKDIPTHKINIIPGTFLHSLSESDEVMVNSTHHQAVDKLGKNLTVSAIAQDGIIEAIEMDGSKFVVGVEWHPEYNNTCPLNKNLFQKFIDSCRKS